MKLILVIGLVILLAVIVVSLRRKKMKIVIREEKIAMPELITKVENKLTNPSERFQAQQEASTIIEDLKGVEAIRPEGNQQRNLDRETGGFEEKEKMQSSEKDVWDDRSEEIDKVGAIDQLGSTAKKSMIWRKKKEKMEDKKRDKARDASEYKGTGTNYDSRSQKAGFLTMVKSRTDNEPGGSRGM